jgi:enterochelin esterase family protein
VKRKGSPLVEAHGSDSKYQLVTFLWRGATSTNNVVVLGPNWGSPHPANNLMNRIEGTDVWYLTKKLPAGARFEYRLSPNDPLTSDTRGSMIRRATAQADPLNPNDWECTAGSPKHECYSAVELPGAAPQPWLMRQPGKPTGTIENHEVHSEIQKLDRPVALYLPPGYRPEGPPNDLLILFDGSAYLSAENATPTTMDNLIAAASIPPTVAVFVSNMGDRRLTDLVPNPDFADFMAKELIPWVRSRFNVTKDPARTVVGGFSAGGLAAAYMGLRHSGVFGNVLSQSGAFWWAPEHYQNADSTTETNWIVRQYLASPKLPVKFYLEAGTFEMDQASEGGDILESTRHLRDVLIAKGYGVKYQQFVGGHDGLSWRGTLADGLIGLLGSK